MPMIGANCHELRVVDENCAWRILYGLTSDAVVILETKTTLKHVLDAAERRWKQYLRNAEED